MLDDTRATDLAHALAQLGAIEATLRQAGRQPGLTERAELVQRFHALAQTGHGEAFEQVQELAALAEKLTDGEDADAADRSVDVDVLHHATDVLSLMLRDMAKQNEGGRAANVAWAADAVRERIGYVRGDVRRP